MIQPKSKTLKRYMPAFALLVVLGLLVGGYFIVKRVQEANAAAEAEAEAAATTTTETIKLVGETSDKVVEMQVEHDGLTFEIRRDVTVEVVTTTAAASTADAEGDDAATTTTEAAEPETTEVVKWVLESPGGYTADETKLSSAASSWATLTASKIIEENAQDLSVYGLGEGDKTTRLSGTFNDGVQKTYIIGAANPTKDGYYVREEGGNTVYLCSAYTSEKLMLTKKATAALTLITVAEEEFRDVAFERDGALVFKSSAAEDYTWEMSEPVVAPLNSTVQANIIAAFTDLSASAYEEFDTPEDRMAQYGLNPPRYRLELTTIDGEERALLFGNEKSKGVSIYACFEGTADVFSVSLESFPFLDKPIKEIIDPFAYIISIDQVQRVTAHFDGKDVIALIKTDAEDHDNDQFILDGRDVTSFQSKPEKEYEASRNLFRTYYQALIGVTVYDLEPDAEPAGDPEVWFKYELKSEPYEMIVDFIPKDDRLYYVMRNGEYTGIVVEKRIFDQSDGLRACYQALVNALAEADAEKAAATTDGE